MKVWVSNFDTFNGSINHHVLGVKLKFHQMGTKALHSNEDWCVTDWVIFLHFRKASKAFKFDRPDQVWWSVEAAVSFFWRLMVSLGSHILIIVTLSDIFSVRCNVINSFIHKSLRHWQDPKTWMAYVCKLIEVQLPQVTKHSVSQGRSPKIFFERFYKYVSLFVKNADSHARNSDHQCPPVTKGGDFCCIRNVCQAWKTPGQECEEGVCCTRHLCQEECFEDVKAGRECDHNCGHNQGKMTQRKNCKPKHIDARINTESADASICRL